MKNDFGHARCSWAEDYTAPGAMDGKAIHLVKDGKPNPEYPLRRAEALALMARYNAHPPADGEFQVLSTGAAVRERKARKGR